MICASNFERCGKALATAMKMLCAGAAGRLRERIRQHASVRLSFERGLRDGLWISGSQTTRNAVPGHGERFWRWQRMATVVIDVDISFRDDWKPCDFKGEGAGPVPVWTTVQRSQSKRCAPEW